MDEKRAAYETAKVPATGFPESARLCKKCSTKALILLDGCMTCLSCGDSKCG
jgi:carbonic anhydrase